MGGASREPGKLRIGLRPPEWDENRPEAHRRVAADFDIDAYSALSRLGKRAMRDMRLLTPRGYDPRALESLGYQETSRIPFIVPPVKHEEPYRPDVRDDSVYERVRATVRRGEKLVADDRMKSVAKMGYTGVIARKAERDRPKKPGPAPRKKVGPAPAIVGPSQKFYRDEKGFWRNKPKENP